MAKQQAKKEEAAGNGSSALALVQNDELAGVLDDVHFDVDGLGEVGAEDIKLAAKVWNFKGVDRAGDPIAPNVFFDTVGETAKKELDLALVDLTKSNEWREYDESEGKSHIRCRSWDRVTGTMEDGTERPCKGCPDAQWKTDAKGKRTRRCGPVYNVLAVERDTAQPVVLRFKRTSLPVIQQHLNRHHIGKRVVAGRRANYPLFVFQVNASLKMSDDKKYAIPVLERGGVLERAEIEAHAETARVWRETMLGTFRKVAEQDVSEEAPASADASFDSAEFSDDSGAAQPDNGSAKRF